MKLLFTGGDCAASSHSQPTKFECTDYGQLEDRALIVVKDTTSGEAYFEGHVEFGDFLELHNHGNKLGKFLHVLIYSPVGKVLKQEMYLHSGCEGDLALYDQLGALKLMEYYNKQGLVTFLGSFDIALLIELPSTVRDGGSVTLSGLVVDTSYGGAVDLTDQIQQDLDSKVIVKLELPGKMDLSKVKDYTLKFMLSGIRNPDFGECHGSFTLDFSAGYAGHEQPAY